MARSDEVIVLFDGSCGFCTWCVDAAQGYLGARMDYRPYQRADLADLGVTTELAEQSVVFVDGDRVLTGSRAVAAILHKGRRPWPWVARVLDARAVQPLAERGYRFVARHRGRLPGVRPALSSDPPQGE